MKRAVDNLIETGPADQDGWVFRHDGIDSAREPWAETLFALANGALGVRGVIDERPRPRTATFLAAAYETAPIHYHERHKGFAATTDTRIPVTDGTAIAVLIDGVPIASDRTTPLSNDRTLDLRTGLLTRRTVWSSPAGPIAVVAEKLVPLDAGSAVLTRYSITPLDRPCRIAVRSDVRAAQTAAGQGDDPRFGARGVKQALSLERVDADAGLVIQATRHSGIRVVAAMAHDPAGSTEIQDDGLASLFECDASLEAPFVLTKAVAYRTAETDGSSATLEAEARAEATALTERGFDAAIDRQRAALDRFWADADLSVAGDPAAALALRVNLFHVFQSAGRSGRFGIAAKGLTGEGYEGHCFWDGEVFVLPLLACTAPELARAMLEYRYATLDAARDNARALDHPSGALFAWRTISGHECSAHYPSGSAQYHINADIAFAIGFYVAATGNTAFLAEKGGEMLAETARIWIELGHVAEDGAFHIHGVTGPDEYTALIDNNWYTNRMAQAHLRLAADVVERLDQDDPAGWKATSDRIGLSSAEVAEWRRAANAMRLPFDEARDLDAQDDSFLEKPLWDIAGTPREHFPLLLHNHPMTLYRHQVAKQADLVLGLILAGENVNPDRKRRAFDHYASVTVHDSTLSDCSFSVLASEVGRPEAAMHHFREAAFVDLEDRHGNSHHGAHMAAMAGSWQALVWGFGGFRARGTTPTFAPVLPAEWGGYVFTMLWRGTRFQVAADRKGVTYSHLAGPSLTIEDHGAALELASGDAIHRPICKSDAA